MASSRRQFLKSAGAGVIAASVAGCTSDGGGSETTTTTEDGNGGDTDTTTNTSTSGGGGENEMIYLHDNLIDSVDPARHTDFQTTVASMNFYDQVVTIDPETGKVKGNLVTEYNTKNDGKKWNLTIREGVPFHSGRTMEASDVAYSMNRTLAVGQGIASIWQSIMEKGSAKAVDGKTAQFNTTTPYAPLFASLVQFMVVNGKRVKENEESGDYGDHGDYGKAFLEKHSAGTGAYKLGAWKSGDEIVYEKFDDYWQGWEDNNFDRVRFQLVPEVSTVKQLMKQGEADMINPYHGTSTYLELKKEDNIVVPEETSPRLFNLPMNTRREPTDDVNVRKALAHAIDYQTIVNDIFKGGTRANGPVPPTLPGHNDDIEPVKQDLEKAQAALDKSDYSVDEINNIGLTYDYLSNVSTEKKVGLLLQQNLSELGLDLEVKPESWATLSGNFQKPDTTAHLSGIFVGMQFPSADQALYLAHHPSAMGTYISGSWFTTDELTSILEEARKTIDPEERRQLYYEAQEILADAYPCVYLLFPPYRMAYNDSIGGWKYYGISGMQFQWRNFYRKQ